LKDFLEESLKVVSETKIELVKLDENLKAIGRLNNLMNKITKIRPTGPIKKVD
jgi:hypothetical protein